MTNKQFANPQHAAIPASEYEDGEYYDSESYDDQDDKLPRKQGYQDMPQPAKN